MEGEGSKISFFKVGDAISRPSERVLSLAKKYLDTKKISSLNSGLKSICKQMICL